MDRWEYGRNIWHVASFLDDKILRTKYETVDIEFIAHHTEAKVVTEEEFFSKGESGGTICSSVYKKH